jgi:uncharacterized membrane protein YccF (DUF307 family)
MLPSRVGGDVVRAAGIQYNNIVISMPLTLSVMLISQISILPVGQSDWVHPNTEQATTGTTGKSIVLFLSAAPSAGDAD